MQHPRGTATIADAETLANCSTAAGVTIAVALANASPSKAIATEMG